MNIDHTASQQFRASLRDNRAELMARLRDANAAYRTFDIERRELMLAATDYGIPVRQIASAIGESPSSVAFWIRRAREDEGANETQDVTSRDANPSVPSNDDVTSGSDTPTGTRAN